MKMGKAGKKALSAFADEPFPETAVYPGTKVFRPEATDPAIQIWENYWAGRLMRNPITEMLLLVGEPAKSSTIPTGLEVSWRVQVQWLDGVEGRPVALPLPTDCIQNVVTVFVLSLNICFKEVVNHVNKQPGNPARERSCS